MSLKRQIRSARKGLHEAAPHVPGLFDPFADNPEPQEIQRKILESDVENPAKKWMRERGYWVRKFKSPSNRSVPDDLFAHKLYGIFAVEFKAPGKTSTDKQKDEQNAMEEAGWEVWRDIDNLEKFKKLVVAREASIRISRCAE